MKDKLMYYYYYNLPKQIILLGLSIPSITIISTIIACLLIEDFENIVNFLTIIIPTICLILAFVCPIVKVNHWAHEQQY